MRAATGGRQSGIILRSPVDISGSMYRQAVGHVSWGGGGGVFCFILFWLFCCWQVPVDLESSAWSWLASDLLSPKCWV